MKKLKRSLALMLVTCMLCSFLPVGAFAAGNDAPEIAGTSDAPFKQGTGGSNSFRIPAIVTLSDGTLVAAADARWNTTYDGGGLDTMVAISEDNGATWTHSFANYLGDNGNEYNGSSSCFIDPSLAVTADDTIYMLCDLYPNGVALNGDKECAPAYATGFNANGKLKLTAEAPTTYDDSHFTHYLDGDKIYANNGDVVGGLTVDAYFNVTGTYNGETVNSNLFFADSPFHVARTGFLYLTKSTDRGESWSEPTLLNLKTSDEMVCLVGPNGGMVTSNGVIVFPVYSYTGSAEYTGLIYSEDNGATWQRSSSLTAIDSSEADAVELGNGNLRVFFRNETTYLCYADYDLTTDTWVTQANSLEYVNTRVLCNSNTELSAIKYSKTVDGKQVILVSCPASANLAGSSSSDGSWRTSGRIFAGLVDPETYEMTWLDNSVAVTPVATSQLSGNYTDDQGFFAYSSMTERKDGSVYLLYENNQHGWGSGNNYYYTIASKSYTESELETALGVTFGETASTTTVDVSLKVGETSETYTDTTGNYENAEGNVDPDSSIATMDVTGTAADKELVEITALDQFVSGKSYFITSRNGQHVLKDEAFDTNNNALKIGGVVTVDSTELWTFTATGTSEYFTIARNGKYLNIADGSISMGTDSQNLRVYRATYNGETHWIIADGKGNALNNSGQNNQKAGEYSPDAGGLWRIYEVAETTPGSTTVSFTGKAVGRTTAVVGDTTYNITVLPENAANTVNIEVQVGKTYTYTDTTGNHAENISLQPNNSIATMTVTDKQISSGDATYDVVNELVSGERYLITKNNAMVTGNTSTGHNGSWSSAKGLLMTTDTAGQEQHLWTITKVENGYTIMNANGKYMNIAGNGNNNVTLSDTPVVLTIVDNGDTFTIHNNNYCLNNFGGENRFASSYSGTTDVNAAWTLKKYNSNVTDVTEITFKGVASGNTAAVVGNTLYNITVTPDGTITVEINYTYNGTVIKTERIEVAENASTLVLDGAIVVDGTAYSVIDRTIELTGDSTIEVPVELYDKQGSGFVGSQDINAGTHENLTQICDLVDGATNTAKKITEMTLTTGISYNLDLKTKLETGYTVEWDTGNGAVATVDADGNVTAVGAGTTNITAVVMDANGNIVEVNSIPVNVYPKGTGNRTSAVYIENIDNTTVYCVVNADTDATAFEVIEGELIYGQFDTTVNDGSKTTAFSFFGAPDEDHALVAMTSTNSFGDYYLLHDDDGEMGVGTQYYRLPDNTTGAGYWQAIGLTDNGNDGKADWTKIEAMIEWAIDNGCDGGMGFTRRQTEGDIGSNLTFISDPVPTISKSVNGILPTTRVQRDFRPYADGMTANVGELVYFNVTVTLKRPTVWSDEDNGIGAITYSEATVTDDVLPGAYFYDKDTDKNWNGTIEDDEGEHLTVKDITDQLNAAWGVDETVRTISLTLVYEIQTEDIPKFEIINTAELSTGYKSHYSKGVSKRAANAQASIIVVGKSIDNVVIDFGQKFVYEGLTDAHLKYVNLGTFNSKYGTYIIEGVGEVEDDGVGNQYYTSYKITYTPNSILLAPDAISMEGTYVDAETRDTVTKVINSFVVYPATTVYYEEGFMFDYANDDANSKTQWVTEHAAKATDMQTFELLGKSTFDNNNTFTGRVSDKQNAYGYDPLYEDEDYDYGDSWAEAKNVGQTTSFDFTGTGFDLYANCTLDTGYVAVMVKNAETGKYVKMYTVDTIAQKDGTAATDKYTTEEFHLPIVSVDGLDHATYTVTITKIMDTDPVKLDGIRIHGTIVEASTSEYAIDLEDHPEFYQLRDYVLHAVDVDELASEQYGEGWLSQGSTLIGPLAGQVYGTISTDTEAPAEAIVTSVEAIYKDKDTAQDLLDNGPKNELFLFPEQTLTFKVTTSRAMQIGLKAPRTATNYTLKYTVNGNETSVATNESLATSVDMFYELDNPIGNDTTYLVSITNTGRDILSVTDLKICDDPNAAFIPLTEEDIEQILQSSLGAVQTPEEPEVQMPFQDVSVDSYYYESVLWALENGITTGLTAEHFGAENACNRSQAVTFLWRAAGCPEPTVTEHNFVDIEAGSFYEKAVLWALENGITNGTDSAHFSPNMKCTRAQIVTFLYRAYGEAEVVDVENPFTDVLPDAWYTDAVLWAVDREITNGLGGGVFGVDNTCTRAQIVTFLYRANN